MEGTAPAQAAILPNLNQLPPAVAPGSAKSEMRLPRPSINPIDEGMVRKWVSYWLLGMLSVIILLGFATLVWLLADGQDHDIVRIRTLMDLLTLVFGPVIALVSSVVGFYFGARTVTEAKAGRSGG